MWTKVETILVWLHWIDHPSLDTENSSKVTCFMKLWLGFHEGLATIYKSLLFQFSFLYIFPLKLIQLCSMLDKWLHTLADLHLIYFDSIACFRAGFSIMLWQFYGFIFYIVTIILLLNRKQNRIDFSKYRKDERYIPLKLNSFLIYVFRKMKRTNCSLSFNQGKLILFNAAFQLI